MAKGRDTARGLGLVTIMRYITLWPLGQPHHRAGGLRRGKETESALGLEEAPEATKTRGHQNPPKPSREWGIIPGSPGMQTLASP